MRNKIEKALILITLIALPVYLVNFSLLGIPTNALEILALLVLALFYSRKENWLFLTRNWLRSGLNKIITAGIIAIFGGLFISTWFAGNWREGLGIIKGWFLIPFLFSLTVYLFVKKEEGLEEIVKWLYLGISAGALVSLIYYFSGVWTYDGRLRAFFLSPNHLAMYLAPGLFLGFYLLKARMHHSRLKICWSSFVNQNLEKLYLVGLVLILVAFYLTYSYAAWVAVVISWLAVSFLSSRAAFWRKFFIGFVIFLLIIGSQWNTEKFSNLKDFSRSSLESRFMIWQAASKILADNPFWGIGPGNFQDKYLEYQKFFPPYLEWAVPQPHNLFLAFWLQSGWLGLFGFLTLIFVWLKKATSFINRSPLIFFLEAVMFYILFHGLLDTPYWKNDLAFIFWLVFFLGLKAVDQEKLRKTNSIKSPVVAVDKIEN